MAAAPEENFEPVEAPEVTVLTLKSIRLTHCNPNVYSLTTRRPKSNKPLAESAFSVRNCDA